MADDVPNVLAVVELAGFATWEPTVLECCRAVGESSIERELVPSARFCVSVLDLGRGESKAWE